MKTMAAQQEGNGGRRRTVREARLADKLRQNLGRRKAKARAVRNTASGEPADPSERRAPVASTDLADECES